MDDRELLRETYRLAQENNKLLHKMRRSAFWGTVITWLIYAALIIAPVYLYLQYLSPVVDQMFKTARQFQGTGAEANAQLQGLQQAWQTFESKFKSASSTPQ